MINYLINDISKKVYFVILFLINFISYAQISTTPVSDMYIILEPPDGYFSSCYDVPIHTPYYNAGLHFAYSNEPFLIKNSGNLVHYEFVPSLGYKKYYLAHDLDRYMKTCSDRPSNEKLFISYEGFDQLFATCRNHPLLTINKNIGIINFGKSGGGTSGIVAGEIYFDQGFSGNFNINLKQKGFKFVPFTCVDNPSDDKQMYDLKMCKLAPTDAPFGALGCGNLNPSFPGTNISVLAQGDNNAYVGLYWQNSLNDYCDEVFDQGAIIVEQGGGSDPGNTIRNIDGTPTSWLPVSPSGAQKYYPNNIKLSGLGRHEVRMRIKDRFGNEYYTNPITITVNPSCYAQIPIISMTGGEVVLGGYGASSGIGGYRVVQDVENTLYFGDINDFSSHYSIYIGDGRVTTDIDPLPKLNSEIDLLNTGLHVTEYIRNGNNNIIGIKFRVRDRISSYNIDIIKKNHLESTPSNPNLGNACYNYLSINITVGGENELYENNCLVVVAPSTISTLFPKIQSYFAINATLQYFSYQVSSAQGVIVRSEGGDGVFLQDGARLFIAEAEEEIPTAEEVDNNKNWIQAKAYDDEGRIISEGKQYFDNRGRATQSQVKNLSAGVVMASQTLYDKYGRPAISTLPAPVRARELTAAVDECGNNIQAGQDMYFIYKNNFVTKSATPYSYIHFDDEGVIAKKNNPDGLDATQPGTLGWYYGQNNHEGTTVNTALNENLFIEPYVAQTAYPYTRTLYLEDGTNEVLSTTLPGDQHKAGSGHVASTLTTALTQADKDIIEDYLEIRNTHVFPGILTNPTILDNEAFRVSVKDIEQDETITIQDAEGRTIITKHIASGKMSFVYYDIYNRVVCSITPNGLAKLLLDKTNPTLYSVIDKTTSTYNYKGQLIETKEKDFGTTRFMYRRDGMLRYSQNDKQLLTNSFAYTLYDYANRPIESGLFTPTTGSALLFGSDDLKQTLEENATNADLNINLYGTKSEVIYTVYDLPDQQAITSGDITDQTFVRGKVSYNYRIEAGTGNMIKTWFSYDERGRNTWIAQRLPGLGIGTSTYGVKKMSYTYAANGSVKEVAYTGVMPNDNFYHVYKYDKDSRLTHVYTTTTAPIYNTSGEITNGNLQAHYDYYLHGPLKRVELAENLQGLDYAYTPQGWLKAINYPNSANDPGKDGATASAFPEDVFGMKFDYFTGDYLPKTGNNIQGENYYNTIDVNGTTYRQYFNGNISGVSWHTKNQLGVNQVQGYAYEYDNSYQLHNADYLSVTNPSAASLVPYKNTSKFREHGITYDANGNIKTLKRTDANAAPLHDFQYVYNDSHSNQLSQVTSLIDNTIYASYIYDAIGQLREIIQNGTTTYVHFDNRGMLTAQSANADGTNPIVKFYYDDKGLRYKKETYNTAAPFQLLYATYYVHDAGKHTVAIYDNNNATNTLEKVEVPIYGSDRIGMLSLRTSNQYQYEIKDHLGSVRSVISPVYQTPPPISNGMSFEGTTPADIAFYGSDYTAYAKAIPASVTPKYGSKCLSLTYPAAAVSPAYTKALKPGDRMTSATILGYRLAGSLKLGTLVSGFFDQDNNQLYYDSEHLIPAENAISNAGAVGQWSTLSLTTPFIVPQVLYNGMGSIVDMDNIYLHVYVRHTIETGGVEILYDEMMVNITYEPKVNKSSLQGLIAWTDYYPGGMPMPDKNYTDGNGVFRYGYQGNYSEKDQETGWNAFELRMYDPALMRWNTIDPRRQYASGYVAMGNNPVSMVDPDGGYSKAGAFVRSLFGGGGGHIIYRETDGEYGYNTSKSYSEVFNGELLKGVEIASHYGTVNKGGQGASGSWEANTGLKVGYDVNRAVKALNKNALDCSSGKCAKYVRTALEAGGINTTGRPVSAKDYTPFLQEKGFSNVSADKYTPVLGDIVIMGSFTGVKNHPHGHIQMYNGTKWVSDFNQNSFWPGSDYRNFKPKYTILR